MLDLVLPEAAVAIEAEKRTWLDPTQRRLVDRAAFFYDLLIAWEMVLIVRSNLVILCAALLLISSEISAEEIIMPDNWRIPPEGLVRDERAAITIARAVWVSINPEVAQNIGSDEVWQSIMTAKLDGEVWIVEPRPNPNMLGGGVRIALSKKDARILNMYWWQ